MESGGGIAALRSWSFFTVGLVLAQLLVGGLVRHLDYSLAGRLHLLLAFAVEPSHDESTLERYLSRYPQYATDLVDLLSELSCL